MPRRKLQTRSRAWPRVVILGLVGIAAAACSDSARFDSYNADRPVPPHNVTSPVSGRPAGGHSVVAAHPPTPPPKTAQPQTVKPEKVASLPAVQNAPVAKEESRTTETVVKAAEPSGAMPSFGWPVRGRLIAGFGSKPDGTQNDGINLAVPEGTPIKAADDGVVAYAGNELKGYGNLVLIQPCKRLRVDLCTCERIDGQTWGHRQARSSDCARWPDRQRDLAAIALRDQEGIDPGRPDPVSGRCLVWPFVPA